jgi:glycosyltransferase involved in cell wall biosynthesis
MIGVIVPAHNEQDLLPHCLKSLHVAARHPALGGEPVEILVVLDSCDDASGKVARGFDALTLSISARNVGHARRVGAACMLSRGARWLACTDADSQVPADWLMQQLSFKADVVCGTVQVLDWEGHGVDTQTRYLDGYQACEDHRHIHGANLGICAKAYRRAGGFKPLTAHEDVGLVQALERSGAKIVWTALNSVSTSARSDPRAREGFGDYLKSLAVAAAL